MSSYHSVFMIIADHCSNSTLLSDTCSKTDQVAGDDAVHTEVLRDLVLYLVQTLVVAAIIHPAENAVILEQLLAA